jgi:hypothetical protein
MSAFEFQLRTRPLEPALTATSILLDAFDGHDRASTIQTFSISNRRPQTSVPLSSVANDFLWLAIAVLAADTSATRSQSADRWTRDVKLVVPVASPRWAANSNSVERMLEFLTGDRWRVEFVDRAPRLMTIPEPIGDVVCLLSGGLDSLIGAIDLLAQRQYPQVLLVGAHDSQMSASKQIDLTVGLQGAFRGRVDAQRTGARLRKAHQEQERPLPSERENTTRSRSLYFIAAGLARAVLLGPDTPLFIPENGVIGLNVPVSPSRAGSLSTRTTHPHFMRLLRQVLDAVGIANQLENPYRLMTKGEALLQSADPAVLGRLAPTSISCAHPLALRYRRCIGSCGYCYPCLIRRASMHAFGLDGPDGYCVDVLTDRDFLDAPSSTSASLLAVITAIHRGSEPIDVLRNGPIEAVEIPAFARVHREGLHELETWLRTSRNPDLLRMLP